MPFKPAPAIDSCAAHSALKLHLRSPSAIALARARRRCNSRASFSIRRIGSVESNSASQNGLRPASGFFRPRSSMLWIGSSDLDRNSAPTEIRHSRTSGLRPFRFRSIANLARRFELDPPSADGPRGPALRLKLSASLALRASPELASPAFASQIVYRPSAEGLAPHTRRAFGAPIFFSRKRRSLVSEDDRGRRPREASFLSHPSPYSLTRLRSLARSLRGVPPLGTPLTTTPFAQAIKQA